MMDRAEALKFAEEMQDKLSYRLECAQKVPARSYYEKQYENQSCNRALREQEQSKWISVKERLPEYGARVLVYDNMDDRNYMGIWSLEIDQDDGSDCWEDEGGWWQPLAEVTHWMPLPEPPREGAGHE